DTAGTASPDGRRTMAARHDRRRFLKLGCGAAAVSLLRHRRSAAAGDDVAVHFETRSAARQDGRDAIHMHVHGIEDRFGRHAVLGGAAAALHSRFRDVRVASNARDIARGYFIDGRAWKDSNIEPHPTIGPEDMLWQQLALL